MRLCTLLAASLVLFGCGDDDSGDDDDDTTDASSDARNDTGGGSDARSDREPMCEETCSATETCFPRVASCVCMGGRMVEFDNCVEGCCSQLDLEDKCAMACAN